MPLQFTSTAALLVANLLPIVGVLLWDWDVRSIVTLYWTENLIIGAIMLLKMFYLGRFKALPKILFFLVHYGIFCFAHGVFIGEFFAPLNPQELPSLALAPTLVPESVTGDSFAEPVMRIFREAGQLWWWGFATLGLSHLVSFAVNWLGQGEYRGQTVATLMNAPYNRIVILHITIIVGGIAITELGAPLYLVVILVLVKILVDITMHRREHRAAGRVFAADSDD